MAGMLDRWRNLVQAQVDKWSQAFRRLDGNMDPEDPLVAVIRREGLIDQGRYVMYFEVTLFGNNPVVLEEFGPVLHRDREPPPPFRQELAALVHNYQYFIKIQQRFKSVEEARDFWLARGATAFWHD